MDYKFRLSAFQHAAGSEDAKIKISIGDTVLVAEAAVSGTSEDSPTEVIFDASGLASVGSGASVDIKVEIVNDYYVDENTFRRITIKQLDYIYKDESDATYTVPIKTWIGTPGVETEVDMECPEWNPFRNPEWIRSDFDITEGDNQGTWSAGMYARIYDDYVTLSAPLTTTWAAHWDETYTGEDGPKSDGRLVITKEKYQSLTS
jgi:hypothetical protein